MTPDQFAALVAVHGGDLVLLTTPEGLASPPHEIARLLLVDSIRFVGTRTHRTIFVRGSSSLEAQDWITFQRNPASFWRNFQQGRPVTDIDLSLTDEDIVLVRPAFDDLFHTLFNGSCPFIYCHDGLVTISSATRVVLRDTAEAAPRYGFNMHTLCPFCMGTALYRDHEVLVDLTDYANRRPRHDAAIREEHIGRINGRRSEIGYRPVAGDTMLNDLRLEGDRAPIFGIDPSDLTFLEGLDIDFQFNTSPGSEITEHVRLGASDPRAEAIRNVIAGMSVNTDTVTATTQLNNSDPRAEALRNLINELSIITSESRPATARPSTRRSSMLALPPAPIIAPVQTPGAVVPGLRLREWYLKAAARVLASECQICLEKFLPGEVVADLPCWHFFHMECWSHVEGGKCPFRCNAEALVPVAENDEVVD